jgi:hypothetical protein
MPSTPEPRFASRSWHASRASRLRYQQALIWREMRRLARSRDELARGLAPAAFPEAQLQARDPTCRRVSRKLPATHLL